MYCVPFESADAYYADSYTEYRKDMRDAFIWEIYNHNYPIKMRFYDPMLNSGHDRYN